MSGASVVCLDGLCPMGGAGDRAPISPPPAPASRKICEQLQSHTCQPSRAGAVDTGVQNLRVNHRIAAKTVHTARPVHSARGVHPSLSTLHAHRDTPTVLGKQASIPRFHSAYYCYSNIFQEFSSEEAPWGDRARSPREPSPPHRMSARSISFQVGAESSTVFHRRRFSARVIRRLADGATLGTCCLELIAGIIEGAHWTWRRRRLG